MTKKRDTKEEFRTAKELCRSLFIKKMKDYGTSWTVMRPSSLTDQIMIKGRRIRSIQEKGESRINEGIEPEFIGIVNYAVMALIQLGNPVRNDALFRELHPDEALGLYDEALDSATALMENKNHDYDEAWRDMRVSSFTDIILQKIRRTKEIEDNCGRTIVSEGLDANYMDMINYSLFALIKLSEMKGEN